MNGIIKESMYVQYQSRSAHKINMYYEKVTIDECASLSITVRDLFLKLHRMYIHIVVSVLCTLHTYYVCTPYGVTPLGPCTCRLRLRRIVSVGAAPSPFLHTFSASPGLNFIES